MITTPTGQTVRPGPVPVLGVEVTLPEYYVLRVDDLRKFVESCDALNVPGDTFVYATPNRVSILPIAESDCPECQT